MKKSFFCTFAALAVTAVLTVGTADCFADNSVSETQAPITSTAFKLDTIVTVTIYDSQDTTLLEGCMEICDKYETIFSRTNPDSELYQLNHRELPEVNGSADTYQISEPLAELISEGLAYSKESEGAFDIAVAPLTSLWDFTSEAPQVPEASAIQEALSQIGSSDVSLKGQNISLPSPDTAFDLGGIAKGYIADRIKDYLVSEDVESALISLGGNVVCIGDKPDGTPFRIGVQKPFADRNETVAIMEITDRSVVSSGIYERCFEEDGKLYHHILDPSTGYPYENDLVAVTIVSDNSVDGDALSTACFALGYEKGLAFAQSHDNIQAIFITKDYQIHYTEGFRDAVPIEETSE